MSRNRSLRSFDIFDTLLVRACGRPEVVFDILALRVLGQDSALSKRADFALQRIIAARKCAEFHTLKDIYSHADFSTLTHMPNNLIMDLELQIESEILVGVDRMRKMIQKFRANGDIICYTSDMYLPSNFLTEVLKREGYWQPGDEVFVSCEHLATKRSGKLFKLLRRRFPDMKIHHYGDNHESDQRMLRRSIKNKRSHKIVHNLSAYQRCMAQMPDFCQLQRPLVLAALSKAVLINRETSTKLLPATDLFAPLLVSVVCEIMQRAQRNGVHRLIFLARDGQIMHEIAKELKPLFPDIETDYLYISRTSLYIPSMAKVNAEEFESLFGNVRAGGHSIENILRTYLPGVNLPFNFHPSSFEEALSNSTIKSEIIEYYEEQKQLLNEYFITKGLTQNNVGIVDLITSGKSIECINRFLTSLGHKPVPSYILHASSGRLQNAEFGCIESSHYTERCYGNYCRISGAVYILEDYAAAANHSRTTHYGRDKYGHAVPILQREDDNTANHNAELFAVHSSICREYARYFMSSGLYIHNEYNVAISLHIIAKFSRNPLPEYLDALIDASYDNASITTGSLVQKLSLVECFKLLKARGNYGSWARGSVVATFGYFGHLAIYLLGQVKGIYLKYRR